MPITFAHPAIVLPMLKKRYKLFSATGLIIGSMIPDFESFIRLNEHKHYSHTWLGMFWFDLPLAIITAFLFHNIVRDPLIDNLPTWLENKCASYKGFRWNAYFGQHFVKIIFSMLLGIALHLVWDAFTHLNFAYPDAEDSMIMVGPFRLFKVLQDADSILGMIIVAVYIYLLPGSSTLQEPPGGNMMMRMEHTPQKYGKVKYWAILIMAAITTIIIAVCTITRHLNYVLFIDINITGLLVGLIVAGVLTYLLPDRER